jgi:hypothetical protein
MKLTKINFLVLSMVSTLVLAQSGGDYAFQKHVIANGGGSASGGLFAISGTIGQAAASNEMTGGLYAIASGFWTSANNVSNDIIFKNGFE